MAERQLWAPVDPLGEALHFVRMSGAFYCRSELREPWGLTMPAWPGCLWFHVVTAGRCWLEVKGAGAAPLLRPGDIAVVPHGEGHRLVSKKGVRAPRVDELPQEMVNERYSLLRHGGGGAEAMLVCGAVRFDDPAAQRLLGLLPRVLHVAAASSLHPSWLESTLRLMADEASALRPGGQAVLTRLADVLVIQAIRSWMADAPAARTGWLAALRDDQVGRALTLVHREPARPWTVASLAAAVAMSRSAFAARFTALVGEPAMAYVTRWRMHVASTWLAEGTLSVREIASRLGYDSEAAFSRAFKRIIGVAPGAARRKGVTGAEAPEGAARRAP